jgi:hypothetical protein
MSEIRTVTTLRRKRKEIAASIQLYERQIGQARADLAHVEAAIRIFDASGSRKDMARYVDTHRLFKRRELVDLCKVALAKGPLTTRELAVHCMRAKGLNPDDKVLAKGIGQSLIHSLRMQKQRGNLFTRGKRLGVFVWALPSAADARLL